MARTRQAVKPLNQSAQSVATNAAAEKARKAASRKALKEAKAAEAQATTETAKRDDVEPVAPRESTPPSLESLQEAQACNNAAWLETMAVDFEALNEGKAARVDGTNTPEFNAYLTEQGVTTEGAVKTNVGIGYQGPMLALREAAKTYVTGKNGNPHCGDWMAIALDGLTREQVVERLGKLLFAKGITTSTNPYLGLNPGQQSMNLRNKARGAYGKGLLNDADLKTLQA
jgi:hypothetical protein